MPNLLAGCGEFGDILFGVTEYAIESGAGHLQRSADDRHWPSSFSHAPDYTDLIRVSARGHPVLFAAVAGCLPGDGGTLVDQLTTMRPTAVE